jgi:DNA-binding MarR family transcriptional regulator
MFDGWPDVATAWADPGPKGGNLRVSQFPTFHLLRLASLAKAEVMRRYLEPAGLSVPEWRLLSTVASFSPIAFTDITTMTTMDKGQVSRTLRTAQAKGFVITELVPSERLSSESSAATGNRVVVHITPAGRQLYEQVMPAAQRFQAGLIELMSPDERRVMLDLLKRLNDYLGTEARQD